MPELSKKQQSKLKSQRLQAQTALDKNSVSSGGKHRSLSKKERAAFQRVITRTNKVLGDTGASKKGSQPKRSFGESLDVAKRFAERLKEEKQKLKDIPSKMGK